LNNYQELQSEEIQTLIDANCQKLELSSEVYVSIIKASREQNQQDIALIEQGIETKDYNLIHTASHRLKGVFGNLIVFQISDVVQEIDELSRNSGDFSKINNLLELVKKNLDKLLGSL